MNKFYFFTVLVGCFVSGYSQSKFSGKILNENGALPNVEIINFTKKKMVKSDENGDFQILATVNDEIIFYLKGYIQKSLKIREENFKITNRIIFDKTAIELNEIEIVKAPKIKIDNNYESLIAAKIEKDQFKPQVAGVYTGEIDKGADLMAIGGKLVNLIGKAFKSEDTKKKSKVPSFRKYVTTNFDRDFFKQKLHLEENEIDLFIDFCEKDKDANFMTTKNTELGVLEFLIRKRKEFKPE